jgi:alkanesulfonate monooxygenase SsuD/methylene tetrahydromethanopterin reductase-like flavin-dependent oxidoreductase (luciferase family)
VVVGGHARPALERVARVGDGWFGWDLTPEAAAPVLDRLREARAWLGGPRLEITIAPPDPFLTAETAGRYAALGVDRLVLVPPQMSAATTDAVIDHAATNVIG